MADIKEVYLETTVMEGGAITRRRRRKAKVQNPEEELTSSNVSVEKHEVPVKQTESSTVVVLAPAKKKTKVMLVSKGKPVKHVTAIRKTFKAKRVHVTIDNTEKTRKRQRHILGRVDAMTDDQVRAAAVGAKLSRRESVATVPSTLLRQMIKDYQTMKGNLL